MLEQFHIQPRSCSSHYNKINYDSISEQKTLRALSTHSTKKAKRGKLSQSFSKLEGSPKTCSTSFIDNLFQIKNKQLPLSYLEDLYIRNSDAFQEYLENHKEGLKLIGNSKYIDVDISDFLEENEEYRQFLLEKIKEKNFDYIDNNSKEFSEEIGLTPLPSKSRLLMKTNKEIDDFKKAERLTVYMRMIEYTHQIMTEEGKKKFFNTLREKENQRLQILKLIHNAAIIIQRWWRKIILKIRAKKEEETLKKNKLEQARREQLMKINKGTNFPSSQNKQNNNKGKMNNKQIPKKNTCFSPKMNSKGNFKNINNNLKNMNKKKQNKTPLDESNDDNFEIKDEISNTPSRNSSIINNNNNNIETLVAERNKIKKTNDDDDENLYYQPYGSLTPINPDNRIKTNLKNNNVINVNNIKNPYNNTKRYNNISNDINNHICLLKGRTGHLNDEEKTEIKNVYDMNKKKRNRNINPNNNFNSNNNVNSNNNNNNNSNSTTNNNNQILTSLDSLNSKNNKQNNNTISNSSSVRNNNFQKLKNASCQKKENVKPNPSGKKGNFSNLYHLNKGIEKSKNEKVKSSRTILNNNKKNIDLLNLNSIIINNSEKEFGYNEDITKKNEEIERYNNALKMKELEEQELYNNTIQSYAHNPVNEIVNKKGKKIKIINYSSRLNKKRPSQMNDELDRLFQGKIGENSDRDKNKDKSIKIRKYKLKDGTNEVPYTTGINSRENEKDPRFKTNNNTLRNSHTSNENTNYRDKSSVLYQGGKTPNSLNLLNNDNNVEPKKDESGSMLIKTKQHLEQLRKNREDDKNYDEDEEDQQEIPPTPTRSSNDNILILTDKNNQDQLNRINPDDKLNYNINFDDAFNNNNEEQNNLMNTSKDKFNNSEDVDDNNNPEKEEEKLRKKKKKKDGEDGEDVTDEKEDLDSRIAEGVKILENLRNKPNFNKTKIFEYFLYKMNGELLNKESEKQEQLKEEQKKKEEEEKLRHENELKEKLEQQRKELEEKQRQKEIEDEKERKEKEKAKQEEKMKNLQVDSSSCYQYIVDEEEDAKNHPKPILHHKKNILRKAKPPNQIENSVSDSFLSNLSEIKLSQLEPKDTCQVYLEGIPKPNINKKVFLTKHFLTKTSKYYPNKDSEEKALEFIQNYFKNYLQNKKKRRNKSLLKFLMNKDNNMNLFQNNLLYKYLFKWRNINKNINSDIIKQSEKDNEKEKLAKLFLYLLFSKVSKNGKKTTYDELRNLYKEAKKKEENYQKINIESFSECKPEKVLEEGIVQTSNELAIAQFEINREINHTFQTEHPRDEESEKLKNAYLLLTILSSHMNQKAKKYAIEKLKENQKELKQSEHKNYKRINLISFAKLNVEKLKREMAVQTPCNNSSTNIRIVHAVNHSFSIDDNDEEVIKLRNKKANLKNYKNIKKLLKFNKLITRSILDEPFNRILLKYLQKSRVNMNDQDLITLIDEGNKKNYMQRLAKMLKLNLIHNKDYENNEDEKEEMENISFKNFIKKLLGCKTDYDKTCKNSSEGFKNAMDELSRRTSATKDNTNKNIKNSVVSQFSLDEGNSPNNVRKNRITSSYQMNEISEIENDGELDNEDEDQKDKLRKKKRNKNDNDDEENEEEIISNNNNTNNSITNNNNRRYKPSRGRKTCRDSVNSSMMSGKSSKMNISMSVPKDMRTAMSLLYNSNNRSSSGVKKSIKLREETFDNNIL